jgi:hypothetical protein
MDFVDDIDFVTCRYGAVVNRFDNFTRIIYASMTGSINFQNIDMASSRNRSAIFTYPAWLQRGFAVAISPNAVKTFGKKPCGRGFANAAYTCQDKGMGKAAKRQSVAEGTNQRILSD